MTHRIWEGPHLKAELHKLANPPCEQGFFYISTFLSLGGAPLWCAFILKTDQDCALLARLPLCLGSYLQ